MFLYAISSRGVDIICDGFTQTLECVSVSNKFREFSQPHTRDKMKEWEKESFIALFLSLLIHAYRVQLGCLLQLTHFDKEQP